VNKPVLSACTKTLSVLFCGLHKVRIWWLDVAHVTYAQAHATAIRQASQPGKPWSFCRRRAMRAGTRVSKSGLAYLVFLVLVVINEKRPYLVNRRFGTSTGHYYKEKEKNHENSPRY
jgi:hypothetical protein